ncbi:hypothetical protein AWE51_12520 [Aquimarina aggregata]|uniref:Uncharacterized protein n=1 Tax=Aquimarina aggregata TaxID=1642818 RepID=A0A162YUF4_9FLAO|nr:hypothetical protein [Aquimarina aggregata]KZS39360.1 hypothetical protein AWE51_12520 [Aquimarina aggregata]
MEIEREHLITLLYVIISIELITAVVGTLYLKKYKDTKLKYFVFFLWYTAINEAIGGIYLKRYVNIEWGDLIYNIYYFISFGYLLILYKNHLVNKRNKSLAYFFLVTYIALLIINGFYQNYVYELQIIPYIAASCFLVITISLYFIEILNSQRVLYVSKNLLFWISIGLLLYHIGNIPFRILRNYYTDITDATTAFLLGAFLTVTMNLSFIFGFIWSSKKQKYYKKQQY